MLHVAACLWDANDKTKPFSRCFDESWVDKLYRGFQRNLTAPFRFVLFTDRARKFQEDIDQQPLTRLPPDYGSLIEPFALDEPSIVCGLDMVIVSNVDHFADYCMTGERVALPRNPYKRDQSINPVALVPKGHRRIYDEWRGENDMEWLRKQDTVFIDDMWAGQVLSLKANEVRHKGLQGARIVYMHGEPKAHQLGHLDWVREHWR